MDLRLILTNETAADSSSSSSSSSSASISPRVAAAATAATAAGGNLGMGSSRSAIVVSQSPLSSLLVSSPIAASPLTPQAFLCPAPVESTPLALLGRAPAQTPPMVINSLPSRPSSAAMMMTGLLQQMGPQQLGMRYFSLLSTAQPLPANGISLLPSVSELGGPAVGGHLSPDMILGSSVAMTSNATPPMSMGAVVPPAPAPAVTTPQGVRLPVVALPPSSAGVRHRIPKKKSPPTPQQQQQAGTPASTTKEIKRRRTKAMVEEMVRSGYCCPICKTTSTPEWRRGGTSPDGKPIFLCNRCGLASAKTGSGSARNKTALYS